MNIRLKFKEYLCEFDSAIQLYKFTTRYSGEPKKKNINPKINRNLI